MYRIRLHRRVQKFFQTHSDVSEKFLSILPLLERDPYCRELDVKRMQGRIGEYRLIFRVNNDELEVLFLEADSRGSIYK